jgi:hypothetical protein
VDARTSERNSPPRQRQRFYAHFIMRRGGSPRQRGNPGEEIRRQDTDSPSEALICCNTYAVITSQFDKRRYGDREKIRRQDTYPRLNENHCNRYAVAVTFGVAVTFVYA